jgi:hypothetical protein
MNDAGATGKLRVSVATYNQVIFPHPQSNLLMLALERKATASKDGSINVRSQPFGGGIRILDANPLKEIVGEIEFDSEHSKQEGDFRILIPPSKWTAVKEYCLHHLASPDDTELEAAPDRELTEEFAETMGIKLEPDQYTVRPLGFVVEDNPVPTDNADVQGQLTVRLYRIFEVHIIDTKLCKTMIAISQRYSNRELGMLALEDSQNGGNGRVNSVLTLLSNLVKESYLALPPEKRSQKIAVKGYELDESVLAV